jgi:hypothetical protein
MFYNVTQSLLNFLRILYLLEVCVFVQAVKLESPCIRVGTFIFIRHCDTFYNLEKINKKQVTFLLKEYKNKNFENLSTGINIVQIVLAQREAMIYFSNVGHTAEFPRCLSILLLQTSKTDNNALDIDAISNLKKIT